MVLLDAQLLLLSKFLLSTPKPVVQKEEGVVALTQAPNVRLLRGLVHGIAHHREVDPLQERELLLLIMAMQVQQRHNRPYHLFLLACSKIVPKLREL